MAKKKIEIYTGEITYNMLVIWLHASLGDLLLRKHISLLMFRHGVKIGEGLAVIGAPFLMVNDKIADDIMAWESTYGVAK